MAKTMDPILPILSIFGYWAIGLGFFAAPGQDIGGRRNQTDEDASTWNCRVI